MAILFSLYAQCRDAAAVAAFTAHFAGIRWKLADGSEITLDAEPYPTLGPDGMRYEGRCWVTPATRRTAFAMTRTRSG